MGTCKECKWWGRDKVDRYVAEKTDARPCKSPSLISIDAKGYEAVTGSGFGLDYPVCELYTAPDHGCTSFEASHPAIDIGKDAR